MRTALLMKRGGFFDPAGLRALNPGESAGYPG